MHIQWGSVFHVCVFSLTTLNLSGNGLDQTDFSGLLASGTGKACFSSLQSLSLSRNKFVGWATLNDTVSLPSLVELRFLSNPVLDGELVLRGGGEDGMRGRGCGEG